MITLAITNRRSQLARLLLFTTALCVPLEPVMAIEPPILSGPSSSFVTFYGETKVVETALGEVRIWKKGPFLITHVAGKVGPSSISVARTDGAEMHRREAFAVGMRYCGKQVWSVLSKDPDSEVFINADGTFQLTYATPSGKERHVTLTCYPLARGLEKL